MDAYSMFIITGVPYFSNNVTDRFRKKQKFRNLSLKDQSLVRTIQTMLFEMGYREVGMIDGIPGPRFFAALSHYQKDHGIRGTYEKSKDIHF